MILTHQISPGTCKESLNPWPFWILAKRLMPRTPAKHWSGRSSWLWTSDTAGGWRRASAATRSGETTGHPLERRCRLGRILTANEDSEILWHHLRGVFEGGCCEMGVPGLSFISRDIKALHTCTALGFSRPCLLIDVKQSAALGGGHHWLNFDDLSIWHRMNSTTNHDLLWNRCDAI